MRAFPGTQTSTVNRTPKRCAQRAPERAAPACTVLIVAGSRWRALARSRLHRVQGATVLRCIAQSVYDETVIANFGMRAAAPRAGPYGVVDRPDQKRNERS